MYKKPTVSKAGAGAGAVVQSCTCSGCTTHAIGGIL